MDPVRTGQGAQQRQDSWFRNPTALILAMALLGAGCSQDSTTTTAGATSTTTTTSGEVSATTAGNGETTTTAGAAEDRGTAADTFDLYNSMTGQERHDALVAAAQEEGAVIFYSTAPGWDPVIEAFEETYEIEVEAFLGRSDTILQRVTQEYEAGFYGVDVFEDEASAILSREVGITYEYINDELTSLIPGYDTAIGLVPMRLSVPTVAWNTNLVSDDEIPATIEEFADPRWDGRLMMDDGAWPWYSAIHDYLVNKGWSEEEVDEFFRTIVSYSSATGNSIAMTEMLISEENAVGLSVLSQVVDRNAAVGAPITWRKADGTFVEPLAVQPEGGVLMKNAPHPAAALLLMDFILQEGQRILQEAGTYVPTAIPQSGGPLEGIAEESFQPVDEEKFYEQREEWSTRYDELLRGQ